MKLSSEDQKVLVRIGQLLSTSSATERDELRDLVAAELAKLAFYEERDRDLVRKAHMAGPTRPLSLASFTIGYAEGHTPSDAISALEDWITISTHSTYAYAYVENVTTDVDIVVDEGVTIIPVTSAPKEMEAAIDELCGRFNRTGA
jgi:hypothetical protein